MPALNEVHLPFLYQVFLSVGKHFGWQFVPEDYLLTIYRRGMYHDAKGPGLVCVGGMLESSGPLVKIAPQFDTLAFPEIPTRQGVQMTLQIYVGFSFDPRATKRDIAKQLVRLEPPILREIFKRVLRGALLKVAPTFEAEAIARGEVFADLEQRLTEVMQPALQLLGMTLRGLEIQGVDAPDTLRARLELALQRDINIEKVQQYQPAQLAQTLLTELVEKMNLQTMDYMNLGEVLSSHNSQPSQVPGNIIDGQARPNVSQSETKQTPPRQSDPPSGSYLDDDTW